MVPSTGGSQPGWPNRAARRPAGFPALRCLCSLSPAALRAGSLGASAASRAATPAPGRPVAPRRQPPVPEPLLHRTAAPQPPALSPQPRSASCAPPLLLRVFTTNNGRHHRMDEFSRGNVPSSELQIYTWMDATLKELTSLVKEVYPEARKKGTHFNFAIVFTDLKRPGYRVKEIGSTMSGRKGTDDSMTLQSQKFQIGDYLDIAITPPNRAPPTSGRMRPY